MRRLVDYPEGDSAEVLSIQRHTWSEGNYNHQAFENNHRQYRCIDKDYYHKTQREDSRSHHFRESTMVGVFTRCN
jgi:hypothetical protein